MYDSARVNIDSKMTLAGDLVDISLTHPRTIIDTKEITKQVQKSQLLLYWNMANSVLKVERITNMQVTASCKPRML